MTKLRPAGSLKQAVMQLIGGLGADAPGVAGKSLRRLHEWSDPDVADHPPVDVCLALDRAMRAQGLGTPMLDAYRLLVGMPPGGGLMEAMDALLVQLLIETGELAAEHRAAEADGVVCRVDRARILDQLADVRAKLDRIALALAEPGQ
ncbi:hypothetical protein EDC65_2269 [Stella humosa]|uniref:Uncharacterized protein n=1 Tax=Stella humosa TaxID=94 RepID=A0A3N1MCJ6_9PROT|nr:hypothetical protein [Stella humosa]ROQ00470.1 hypothetical protein EDC65_2269 [Stella humosa]BBK30285.1 hypothetical protein STHU_09190 [Stella humosa]